MKTFHILSIFLAVLSISCNNSSIEDFVVGENFITDQTGIMIIDTFTIKTSMIKFDSVISNSSGRILVGSNYNFFSGYKNSNSQMEIIFDDDIDNTEFVYDSLNLILSYDTYYFGDTTMTQTFTVHQLLKNMDLNEEGYLYTTSQFNYNFEPIGLISLKPSPHSKKNVIIKLSDQIGKQLSKMIKEENDTIISSTLFAKFFHGLVIKSQANVKAAVIGFRTTDLTSNSTVDSSYVRHKPEIRLYYHLSPNPNSLTGLYYKFSFDSDRINFNQISENTSNTFIDGISATSNERSSTLTENQIIIQSGSQVFSKFKIPFIDNLLFIGKNSGFIAATLRLYPVKGTYLKSSDLPDSLYVFNADRKNYLTSQVTVPGSTTDFSYAKLNIIKDVEEIVYYELDASNFIKTELNELAETNRSLMIGYNSSIAGKSADYIIFAGENSGKYSPVLKVYYYHN